MINILFSSSYARGEKVLVSKKFKHTKLSSSLNDIFFDNGFPYPSKYITSGPQKRINNAIKTFSRDSQFVINKIKFDFTYLLTLDNQSLTVFRNLVTNQNKNTKIIVGPLLPQDNELILNNYLNKYENIKKLVSSKIALKNTLFEMDHDIDSKSIVYIPSGVISEKEVKYNILNKKLNSELTCLVYFKKRDKEELKSVIDFLNIKNIKFQLFEYGKYDNNKLKKEALKSSFCIFMSRPETQGFAAQEIMACNLPMLVWDKIVNNYVGKELSGTTVTIFDKRCGEIVYNFQELTKVFDKFIINLPEYQPYQLVLEELTFNIFKDRILNAFKEF